jgi:hypothetical protein
MSLRTTGKMVFEFSLSNNKKSFFAFYLPIAAGNIQYFLIPCMQTFFRTLQRQNTEISKQIFPEKEYRGLSPSFHIHASVSDLFYSHNQSAHSAGGNM